MARHADLCGCTDRNRSCPDVPRFTTPAGWRWDGTGDNGMWAVGLMSVGRYFRLDVRGKSDAWEITEKTDNGDEVTARAITAERPYTRVFHGDLLVYSIERKETHGERDP